MDAGPIDQPEPGGRAGFGAEAEASRHQRRAERLRRELGASGATAAQVAASLERAEREQQNWSAGAEGERQVAATLGSLSRYGWTTLHDVRWPGRPQANIDHLAIGPGGVVVIDAKNWTGEVTLRDGELRQNGYRRDRELEAVAAQSAAVTALVAPQHRSAVLGTICLASQDQDPVRTVPGVQVVGRLQLAGFLVGLPHRLTPYDVADLGRHLGGQLGGPTSPALATTAALTESNRTWPRRGRTPRGTGNTTGAPRVRPMPTSTRGTRRPTRRGGRRRRGAQGGLLRPLVTLLVLLLVLANMGRIAGAIGSVFTSVLTSSMTTSVHTVRTPG